MQTNIFRYTFTILLSLLCFCGTRADDSLRISVLTCAPGFDAYAHFGHTALRVKDYDQDEDVVFNYGCFDYTEDMFVYKFIKGETDYLLGVENTDFFFERYRQMGVRVDEQILNLTQYEANNLLRLLVINLQPENVQYRYNYLYDNCTTRARDMIESSLTEEITYKKASVALTARQELHEKLRNAPWLRFGIDLVLGQKLDDADFDKRHQMFIPSHFEAELDSAYKLYEDGSMQPLVQNRHIALLANPDVHEESGVFTPLLVFCLILAIVLGVSIRDFWVKKVSYWLDIVLASVQGLAGIIVAFLFFCSEHPTVDSNWFVIIFNPLYFVYAGYIGYCLWKKAQNRATFAIFAVYGIFFLLMFFVKQVFEFAAMIMAFTLLIRALAVHLTELRISRHKRIKKQTV